MQARKKQAIKANAHLICMLTKADNILYRARKNAHRQQTTDKQCRARETQLTNTTNKHLLLYDRNPIHELSLY